MTTAINWREIDTSTPEGRNALNCEIARRLGYTCLVIRRGDPDEFSPAKNWYQFYDEDELFWEYFPRDWANSVDAALKLITDNPKSERLNIQMFHDTDGWLGHMWAWGAKIPAGGGSVNIYHAIEATPALAICKAWLEMTDGGVK